MKPIRLRDFIEDKDGRIYAVSAYDNEEKVGCVLRYVPDVDGDRTAPDGRKFKKLDFEDAFEYIAEHKPEYLDTVHRIPHADIARVIKPEEEIIHVAARNERVMQLLPVFNVSIDNVGCTGSLLCGLENEASDIDMVVYGAAWFTAQKNLMKAVENGTVSGLSEEMWQKVYTKRVPEIDYETFIAHEKRKWNRGEIDGTYFDLLYTRSYDRIASGAVPKGEVCGKATIEATVTDASLAFDSPAVYDVDHEEISRVLSFTHTYSGQALAGEVIEAKGVVEEHGDTKWLIVGTTREAKGEYIISKTLLETL
ncbi:DNA polymerase subunit beta [Methanogenium organophilum]|uniref:DNA polymerase subunit beta n=1 Tax=Methanogenium organophilum TaxID=2199 RepID=A0A9X9S458_METOG|nr:DNA polymerase subunit beta [Methanogenium organophilum]WAI01336.1 DNA polymerase subunit beta [Methanogenium organophilum]